MLRIFDLCARGLMIALTVILIFRTWSFFAPRPIDRYVHGGLIGAEQTETLFTGFATLPVLYFSKGRALYRFDPFDESGGIPEKPDGFCYRLYDLAIGYQNINDALSGSVGNDAEKLALLPDPQVLAANAVEARHGGSVHRYDCDSLEFAPTEAQRKARHDFFEEALEGNKQWRPHRENAHALLLSLSEELRNARAKADKQKPRRSSDLLDDANKTVVKTAGLSFGPSALGFSAAAAADADVGAENPFLAANGGGALGSLKLTFSTIALFTRDKNWFFQKNEFYVRQDNAEVTYGVDFYHEFHARRSFIGPRHVVVTLPTPRILATDRYSLALAAYPQKFNPAGKKSRTDANTQEEAPQDPIEKAITDELQRQIDRINDSAIATSKGLITDQMRGLMRENGANVVVHFRSKGADRPKDPLDQVK